MTRPYGEAVKPSNKRETVVMWPFLSGISGQFRWQITRKQKMKKRMFLKISSAALAGAALPNMSGCKQADTPVGPQSSQAATRLKNWAGNLEYGAGAVYPESVEQVQAFV